MIAALRLSVKTSQSKNYRFQIAWCTHQRPHFNLAVLLVLRYRNSFVDGPQTAAWISYL